MRVLLLMLVLVAIHAHTAIAKATEQSGLCLDGFCIGQSISDVRLDQVEWITPKKYFTKEECAGVGCQPNIAFYGYTPDQQKQLAEAVSWKYALGEYTVITKSNLDIFRQYKYECNQSARGVFGERRFFGAYKSVPSGHLTVVGWRLIGGELKVYRIVRRYPYQTQKELVELAKKIRTEYGASVLLYDYLSSNAYSDVIQQNKSGWFGRSQMFNPTDLSNNAAELVLIDPQTRPLLEPTSMPESGEIQPLPVGQVEQCSKPMSIQ